MLLFNWYTIIIIEPAIFYSIIDGVYELEVIADGHEQRRWHIQPTANNNTLTLFVPLLVIQSTPIISSDQQFSLETIISNSSVSQL